MLGCHPSCGLIEMGGKREYSGIDIGMLSRYRYTYLYTGAAIYLNLIRGLENYWFYGCHSLHILYTK
jgi:hypothetical protein